MERGLWHYDQANESFTVFKNDPGNPQSLSHNQVNVLYRDKQGVMWIGTKGGLNKYDPENKHFISYKPDPSTVDGPENQVYAIFEDKMGTLWIGTSDGVFEFDRRHENFIYFNLGRNEPSEEYRRVTSIAQDNISNLWFGTWWGIVKYEAVTHRTQHYLPFGLRSPSAGEDPPKTYISNIFIESVIPSVSGSNTVIWVAAQWGLNRIDPESGIIEISL